MVNNNCDFDDGDALLLADDGNLQSSCVAQQCSSEYVTATCCTLKGYEYTVGTGSVLHDPMGLECSAQAPAVLVIVVILLLVAAAFTIVAYIAYKQFLKRSAAYGNYPSVDPWEDSDDDWGDDDEVGDVELAPNRGAARRSYLP